MITLGIVCLLLGGCVWPKRRYLASPKDQTVKKFYEDKGIPVSRIDNLAKMELDSILKKGEKVYVPYEAMEATKKEKLSSISPKKLSHLLLWPIQGATVSSTFGYRWNRYHEGIDLVAPIGTAIHAAASGEVIYSGQKISGYGNMIVIKHAGSVSSVYAHNKKNFVKQGDKIKKGQKIAQLGNSGKSTGPHLHFEVRQAAKPVDPLLLLPKQKKKWADYVIGSN
jgi:murein DD-endopeptidase MepM/ murein hydrolase activator NlpD